MGMSLEDLAQGVVAGERSALARALSLAERDAPAAAALIAALGRRQGDARVIGITGPPGAGKSTLVGAMLRRMLELGQRVAVLAVDPSSPVSGGALLGDRFRIGENGGDDRAFIRSTATRGSLGGLTAAARQMVQLMAAAGFDLVLVETVGTGQSEVDVAALADSLLVVFPPGLGDEMQAIKAGILELADLLVVTKSDTAAAQQACQALQSVAPLWRKAPPIHAVSALSGEGIVVLVDALLARPRIANSVSRADRRDRWAEPDELRESIGRLWRELEQRLPFAAASVVDIQLSDSMPDARAPGLDVLLELRPGGDSFQLGATVGALMALAAERGLACHVGEADRAGGRLRLELRHAAGAAWQTLEGVAQRG